MKTHSFSCLDEDSSSDNGYYGTPSPENKRKRPKRKSTELLLFYIIRGEIQTLAWDKSGGG